MASITSIGIGSGLDIENMITQLVALERSPIDQLEKQASSLQTQLSAYGKLKSGMSTLREDGLEKVRQGLTSIEEVARVSV